MEVPSWSDVVPWLSLRGLCAIVALALEHDSDRKSRKSKSKSLRYLQDQGFRCPTPIQTYAWPVLCKGSDCIGVAKTGSGKTLGYLLPGYVKVKRHEAQERTYEKGPGMLVLAPTRELCQQIYEESGTQTDTGLPR